MTMGISTNKPARERGSVLIAVMVVMVLTMGLVAALIEHFAVAEARAVEESLAKIRVYWAMSGHTDYVLSRARKYIENCTTNPAPADFTADFNNFSFLSSDDIIAVFNDTCGSDGTDIQQIVRTIFYELDNTPDNPPTDPIDDAREWDYENNYTFQIQSSSDNSDGVTEFQFSLFSTNNTIPALENLSARNLLVRPNMPSATVMNITDYYRQ